MILVDSVFVAICPPLKDVLVSLVAWYAITSPYAVAVDAATAVVITELSTSATYFSRARYFLKAFNEVGGGRCSFFTFVKWRKREKGPPADFFMFGS